jgi:hypothetical protein
MHCWEEDIFRFELTLFLEYLGLSSFNLLNMFFVAVMFALIHNTESQRLSRAKFFALVVHSISHSVVALFNFYLAVILHGLYDTSIVLLTLDI